MQGVWPKPENNVLSFWAYIACKLILKELE